MERVWTWLLQLVTSDAELDLPLRSEILCLASFSGIESNFWPVTSEWATFSCYLSKVPQVSLLLIGPMLQEALSVLHEQENRNPNSSVSLSLTSGTFLHLKVPALQLSRWCHFKTLKYHIMWWIPHTWSLCLLSGISVWTATFFISIPKYQIYLLIHYNYFSLSDLLRSEWNLEKWYWWNYLWGRNRDIDIENGLVAQGGEGEGGAELRG